MGKKEKYGNYLCAIGYLCIRQMIVMPRKRKLNNGELQTIPGNVEVFVYHAKHKMAGPFKSKQEGLESAKEMILKNIRYDRYKK
jgi:hypothetical protein